MFAAIRVFRGYIFQMSNKKAPSVLRRICSACHDRWENSEIVEPDAMERLMTFLGCPPDKQGRT